MSRDRKAVRAQSADITGTAAETVGVSAGGAATPARGAA